VWLTGRLEKKMALWHLKVTEWPWGEEGDGGERKDMAYPQTSPAGQAFIDSVCSWFYQISSELCEFW